jgi:hypothetical protein
MPGVVGNGWISSGRSSGRRDDVIVPFSHLALYAAKLPHAEVRALDGYGHWFAKPEFHELLEDIQRIAAE